jgi:hypothetical protein
MSDKQTGSAKLIKLSVILAIFSVIVVGVLLLPKGFKDDLSVIGQGGVSVVLTHDKNLVGGTTKMALLNKVRPDYIDKVNFLAVDVNTPIGRDFMQQQQVGPVALVMFGLDGTRQAVFRRGVSEADLRLTLNQLLSPQ